MVNLVSMSEQYPFAESGLNLCFEAEIQRLAKERDEPIGELIGKLAEMSGVSERMIYYYRNGKSEIKPEMVKMFCEQFGSLALGNAWLASFEIEQTDEELFDLSRFVSKSVRNMLQSGDMFLEAFDDGKIDGHEIKELRLASAKIQRDANRMTEIAESNYRRLRAA